MGKRLHPLMLAGTGSDVGKSALATALCRIFRQDGYRPAPFKAQNMSLNSYATPDGLEIGRAQAVQAEAAGLPCESDMNPLLLKPQGGLTSQVVLNGKPYGNMSARKFFCNEGRDFYRKQVHEAFDRLEQRFNPVVMEGAGSIAELNLHDRDIVNMPMAQYAKADVLLVGDIDRGGVFAQLYGSISLLPPEEKKLIKGVIVNKFRGDVSLFDDGRKILEEICGVPVLGVIPYYDIYIEEEDSMEVKSKMRTVKDGKINICVILLSHLSNFTDFSALEKDERINLYYSSDAKEIERADIIILPGSKNTIDDLLRLRREGAVSAIIKAHENGKRILGICGGYQMLGQEIHDPDHSEGDTEFIPAIGLLPAITTLRKEKRTCQTEFCFDKELEEGDVLMHGYEIHTGVTTPADDVQALFSASGRKEGMMKDNVFGTYMHGVLDNKAFTDFMLKDITAEENGQMDYETFKQKEYDRLADHVRKNLDMERLYAILSEE